MLRSIKQLYGHKLGASDGEIGQVKDFYFDDQNWGIRYLVADTGTWLPGRQVLLSPYSLGRLDPVDKILNVKLTRKQIEASPAIELHQPVSRQYEQEYHRYYGWPYYWEGDGLWGGMRGFPILEVPPQAPAGKRAAVIEPNPKSAEAHLRSAQTVTGYRLQAGAEMCGHICDFMMDAQSWVIGQLVIKTGHRLSGHEVLVPTKAVTRISYEESMVIVNLTSEAIVQSPAAHPKPDASPVRGARPGIAL